METLRYDVRHAVRSLLRNRRFASVALITIVLTVGGITTVFALVNSVLLKPLPYPDADRLVVLKQSQARASAAIRNVSLADAQDYRDKVSSLESLTLYRQTTNTVDVPDYPFQARIWWSNPEMAALLGMRSAMGRTLLSGDDKPDSPRVCVINYDYWQIRYGGSPDVLGKTILLPGKVLVTIVGVAARDFQMPGTRDSFPSIWTTLQPNAADLERNNRFFFTYARLKRDVPIASANAELKTISKQLEAAYPATNDARTAEVTLLSDDLVGSTSPVLWIFLGAVSCVLMIGIANLVSLQIVRNSAREREMSIRAALGAGRRRLVRQLVTETVVLSTLGGVLAIGLTWGGLRILLSTLPSGFPRIKEVGLDFTVFAFALLVATGVGVIFGIVPAWRVTRNDLSGQLSHGSRTTSLSRRRGRLQRSLIAIETALALVLLVGAGLLARSFYRLITTEAHMNEERVVSVNVNLPLTYVPKTTDFLQKVLVTVRALPLTESAAVLTIPPPLSGTEMRATATVQRNNTRQEVILNNSFVSGDFFKTLGVSVIRGRAIADSDVQGAERVSVVNESMAKTIWPGQDPIGKVMGRDGRVVGVVADFKNGRLNEAIMPQMYWSYQQNANMPSPTLMVRLKPGAENAGLVLQAAVKDLEPAAKTQFATMGEVRWKALAAERFRTALLVIFAFGATFLALAGIWGIVSYSVAQRYKEIGLRMALGASLRAVTSLMIREALVPVGIGFGIGLAAALGLTRLLRTLLYGVGTTDPLTFGVAIGVLAIAAVGASFIPARRAVRIDPMDALRLNG